MLQRSHTGPNLPGLLDRSVPRCCRTERRSTSCGLFFERYVDGVAKEQEKEPREHKRSAVGFVRDASFGRPACADLYKGRD